jgi:hypothetical protein
MFITFSQNEGIESEKTANKNQSKTHILSNNSFWLITY